MSPSGSTALYDAAVCLTRITSEAATLDKKVLLIVSDGEDNSSHRNLDAALQEAQRSSALIYAVWLLREEAPESAERDRQALTGVDSRHLAAQPSFPKTWRMSSRPAPDRARDSPSVHPRLLSEQIPARTAPFVLLRVQIVPPPGSGKDFRANSHRLLCPACRVGELVAICECKDSRASAEARPIKAKPAVA